MAPLNPSIWKEQAIGALRVAPINSTVPGCERIAPATSAIELGLGARPGTGSPEPSVTKDEGPGPLDLNPQFQPRPELVNQLCREFKSKSQPQAKRSTTIRAIEGGTPKAIKLLVY